MIFVTDANGANVFSSPDWAFLTGQVETDAQGEGWTALVHDDDRAVVAASLQRAVSLRSPFVTCHRLRFADGTYHWVESGAMPSYCPLHGAFLGFMGSVTEVEAPASGVASGRLGTFEYPAPASAAPTAAKLDLAVDHLLAARTLLAGIDVQSEAVAQAIDLALYLHARTLVRQ